MEIPLRSAFKEKLKRISKEDLKYVEKDLQYYEKASAFDFMKNVNAGVHGGLG